MGQQGHEARELAALVTLTTYGPEALHERTLHSAAEIGRVETDQPVVWIDVRGPCDDALVEAVAERFDVHPLALEDVTQRGQRPKLEPYEAQHFLVLHAPPAMEADAAAQISIVLGPRYVVSFQPSAEEDHFGAVRQRLHRPGLLLRQRGPDRLAYALVDTLVDAFFPVLERYGEQLEELEERVLERPDPEHVRAIHRARQDLLRLRRSLWPTRDLLGVLMHPDTSPLSAETRIYVRDCHDHAAQLLEMVETSRELCADLMEVYLSSVSVRTNEVMKVLTIIATVFLPLSFVAGLYGMNFDPASSPWNMPELRWSYGYLFALGLMGVTALVLLLYFRRRGWLGGER